MPTVCFKSTRSLRLRALTVTASAIALCVALAAPAMADVSITPATGASYSDSGPAKHADLTISGGFEYSPVTDDLKRIIMDTAVGLVGNPNAVPFSERCTPAQYSGADATYQGCPASSDVGDATVSVFSPLAGGAVPLMGNIFLLQTSPELPAMLGINVSNPVPIGFIPIGAVVFNQTAKIEVLPTGGLRTTVLGDFTRPALPNVSPFPDPCSPADGDDCYINGLTVTFDGVLPNGNAFIANPSICAGTWNTKVYARAYDSNTNADADPLSAGATQFVSSTDSDTPNCSSLPPYAPSVTPNLSSNKRGQQPVASFDMQVPNAFSSATTSKVKVTFPGSITANIAGLTSLCTTAQRDSVTCPASSKIGTASINTPMLGAGLSGSLYAVAGSPLPSLSMFVTGALNLRLDASTSLAGDQLAVTFAGLPPLPYSSLEMSFKGGDKGVLSVVKCPTGSGPPRDGPIEVEFSSHAGQFVRQSIPVKLEQCTGVTLPKFRKCVGKRLKFQPQYSDIAAVVRSELRLDGKLLQIKKRVPFGFNNRSKRISKLSSTRAHKLGVTVTYKGGEKAVATTTFKRCKTKKTRR